MYFNEIKNSFFIFYLLTFIFFRENDNSKDFAYIPDYLQALSNILINIANPTYSHLSILTKLTVLLIKKFPDLQINTQNSVIEALKSTFQKINKLEESLQQEYFLGSCNN